MSWKIQVTLALLLVVAGFAIKLSTLVPIDDHNVRTAASVGILGGSLWAVIAIRKLKEGRAA